MSHSTTAFDFEMYDDELKVSPSLMQAYRQLNDRLDQALKKIKNNQAKK